jgi:hypothetical protein
MSPQTVTHVAGLQCYLCIRLDRGAQPPSELTYGDGGDQGDQEDEAEDAEGVAAG